MLTRSEFRKLSGWVDQDRARLHLLSKAQQIEYFRKRIKKVLLSPLRELFRSMKKQKKYCSTVLCFGTCVCCAIEALGKFYTGRLDRRGSWQRFEKWIDNYMNKDYSKTFKGVQYKRLLWEDFRNSLAHVFTIKNGGYDFKKNYFEVRPVGGVTQLEIDPEQFYMDFLSGLNAYIADLKIASPSDRI